MKEWERYEQGCSQPLDFRHNGLLSPIVVAINSIAIYVCFTFHEFQVRRFSSEKGYLTTIRTLLKLQNPKELNRVLTDSLGVLGTLFLYKYNNVHYFKRLAFFMIILMILAALSGILYYTCNVTLEVPAGIQ